MNDNIYNPEFVENLFNRMSGSYERMNYITSFGFSIRWRRQFLNQITDSKEKMEVLDLMTGMGETWSSIKKKFPNSNLTALDFSEKMIQRAEEKSKKHYKNNITILKQDVLKNQLPSNHFDLVISAFGLKTFNESQIKILAKETKRILKTGGQFSFVEVSKPENSFLKFMYGFYLGKTIPILGKILLGNPTEYKMLWRYTKQFENSEKAALIFKEEGLTVNFNSYFFGCSTGFHGKKL